MIDCRCFGLVLCLAVCFSGCDSDSETDAGGGGTDAGPMLDAGAGDAGGGTDAGVDAAVEDAGPPETGHCAATDLLIEAVDPGTSITVFNPTGAAIDTTNYIFCQRPTYPNLGSIEADVTLAPGASHVFAWPAGFTATDAGGEVALYSTPSFTDPEAQIDFVCWGFGASMSRKSVAEMDGDWVGDCAGAVTGESLNRVPQSDGQAAADYDSTGAAAALSCP